MNHLLQYQWLMQLTKMEGLEKVIWAGKEKVKQNISFLIYWLSGFCSSLWIPSFYHIYVPRPHLTPLLMLWKWQDRASMKNSSGCFLLKGSQELLASGIKGFWRKHLNYQGGRKELLRSSRALLSKPGKASPYNIQVHRGNDQGTESSWETVMHPLHPRNTLLSAQNTNSGQKKIGRLKLWPKTLVFLSLHIRISPAEANPCKKMTRDVKFVSTKLGWNFLKGIFYLCKQD